jgi:UTP:GlnB (protein PII) uridylyltransferase
MPDAEVEHYLRDRAALIAAAVPGEAAAHELSDLTDRAVSALAETALQRLGSPWAVLALGGWGAQRLLPHSDLDLLVVTDAPADELRPALEAVLYPLWDAGLEVGHQVRARRDHYRACRDDLETLTATLTGRVLCGDDALARRVLADVAGAARRRSRRLLAVLAQRPRPGSPYLLEPDLKEGAGGQRDLDELTWSAAVASGAPTGDHSALVPLDLLTASESHTLSRARDVITAARWDLGRNGPRHVPVLTLDAVDEVRANLAALHGALADAHHLLLRVRARTRGTSSPPSTDPLSAGELFALLESGHEALAELEDAAWSHRLDDLVPAMSDLMTLRRPALTHAYTVGAHSLRTAVIAAIESARAGFDAGMRRVLLVSTLLHDIGKVQAGPGHAKRGASMTLTLAPRFGLDATDTAAAALLVREHLLLPETSAGEDLHDEDVIIRAAGRIGRADLIAPLHALVSADSQATGPTTWSPWHAALAGELVERIRAALDEDAEDAGIAKRAERTRRGAVALAGLHDASAVERFVTSASLRYLASQRPAEVLAHALLVDGLAPGPHARPRLSVSPGGAQGTWRVSVAAPDRAGLFAAIAGAFALAGLDILSAEAYETSGGTALDVFVVRSDTLAEADPSTWSAFERHLHTALTHPASFASRIEVRRRHYATRSGDAPTVSIEHTGAYATAMYVRAADRVGLLYDIARAISDLGLDIRWARATTRGGTVLDAFHIVGADGEPVGDAGLLGHLAMRIRESG